MSADRAGHPTEPLPVQLVGAGPGDPDLLTLAAEAALLAAREVVADRSLATLVDEVSGAGLSGPAVTFVDDGSGASDAAPELLAAVVRGVGVVRLYRGDPWFHPAGDRERAALRSGGFSFDVIAGVVEELALLADAGIPAQVRTRAVTTTFAVDDRTEGSEPDEGGWLAIPADPTHGLVVRTDDLAATARDLAGRAVADGVADRPAALVASDGRTPLRTTLHALAGADRTGAGVVLVGLVAGLDVGRRLPHPEASSTVAAPDASDVVEVLR